MHCSFIRSCMHSRPWLPAYTACTLHPSIRPRAATATDWPAASSIAEINVTLLYAVGFCVWERVVVSLNRRPKVSDCAYTSPIFCRFKDLRLWQNPTKCIGLKMLHLENEIWSIKEQKCIRTYIMIACDTFLVAKFLSNKKGETYREQIYLSCHRHSLTVPNP